MLDGNMWSSVSSDWPGSALSGFLECLPFCGTKKQWPTGPQRRISSEKRQHIRIAEKVKFFIWDSLTMCRELRKKIKMEEPRFDLSGDEPWHTAQRVLTLHDVEGATTWFLFLLWVPLFADSAFFFFFKLSVRQKKKKIASMNTSRCYKHVHIRLQ